MCSHNIQEFTVDFLFLQQGFEIRIRILDDSEFLKVLVAFNIQFTECNVNLPMTELYSMFKHFVHKILSQLAEAVT
jgi:hypothetical protein